MEKHCARVLEICEVSLERKPHPAATRELQDNNQRTMLHYQESRGRDNRK